jgi:hypothetical protein
MTENKGPFRLTGVVGLILPHFLDGHFHMFAAALTAAGASEIVRLPSPLPARQSLSVRTLLALDRLASRFLPGAALPPPAPPPPWGAAIPDTVVVVGASAPPPALQSYVLRLGAAPDDETVGLTEVLTGGDVAWLSLERAGELGGDRIAIGSMAVQADRRSVTRTRAALAANAAIFLRDVLIAPVKAMEHSITIPQVSVWRLGHHLVGLLRGLFERLFFRSQWVLAILLHSGELSDVQWNELRLLFPPRGRFWADPFIIEKDGRCWLFFEEGAFASGKGHISVAEVLPGGRLGPARIALEKPWHLSYPNVFEHHGWWYMLPEQAACGRLDLYRCKSWPMDWQPHTTLLEERAYDPTLLGVIDGWRLMTARRAPGSATTDFLDIHQAASLSGPWRLQRRGAVMDVRSARPAGRMFNEGAAILRPAQDSSGGVYGRALRIQRLTLNPFGLTEETALQLEPFPGSGVTGIHTLAMGSGFVVVDICLKRPRMGGSRVDAAGPFVRRAQ